jgi:DNA-binding transcriptional LysR family regulator
MEFQNLRVFVEVVRQNGFSRAAKVVFTTQSTVSKAVKQLEHEMGVPLLNRIGRRITLSAAGEVIYRRGLRILAEREDLLAELRDLRGLKSGTLRLGLPPVNTSTLFAPVFALYRNRYPAIDVQLIERGGEQLQQQVLAGEVDVAVSLLPLVEGFQWQEIRREPIVAVLPVGHPLSQCQSIKLADLKDEPFILFGVGFSISRLILDACQRRGFEPIIAARSCQIEFIIELALSGLGVGFLPRMIAENRSVNYVTLSEPDTDWQLAMIWRDDAYLSDAARAWLELSQEYHQSQTHEARNPADLHTS